MKITLETKEKVYKSKPVDTKTMELKGYDLIEELFVDSSGFGAPGEPALTQDQLMRRLDDILNEHGPLYATITRAGQFQVYIGLFKKTRPSNARKIANNTLDIKYPDGSRAYRLHNTDVVTITPEGKYILDSGGWHTVTTKSRINDYIPAGYYVYQKNFEWYVKSPDGKSREFIDGMEI